VVQVGLCPRKGALVALPPARRTLLVGAALKNEQTCQEHSRPPASHTKRPSPYFSKVRCPPLWTKSGRTLSLYSKNSRKAPHSCGWGTSYRWSQYGWRLWRTFVNLEDRIFHLFVIHLSSSSRAERQQSEEQDTYTLKTNTCFRVVPYTCFRYEGKTGIKQNLNIFKHSPYQLSALNENCFSLI